MFQFELEFEGITDTLTDFEVAVHLKDSCGIDSAHWIIHEQVSSMSNVQNTETVIISTPFPSSLPVDNNYEIQVSIDPTNSIEEFNETNNEFCRKIHLLGTPVSIWNKAFDSKFTVFPNPTTGQLNIHCVSTIRNLKLVDINGRTLRTWTDGTTNINLNPEEAGSYILVGEVAGKAITRKVIKL